MRIVEPTQLGLAARVLDAGGLVIVPTSRWYMLCCDAANPEACAQIFIGKQRPPDRSLVFVVPSTQAARQHFHLSREAKLLAEAFWPGDLALLLPWRDAEEGQRHSAVGTPDALVTCAPGILGELSNRTKARIAATSANISGPDGTGPSISLTEALKFAEGTETDVSVVVDGGVCPIANHLTILSCTSEHAELMRDGVVHTRAISAVLREHRLSRGEARAS